MSGDAAQWEPEIAAYFIDVTCVRGIKNVAKGSLFEFLPPCFGCNRTQHLRPGAASFQLEIEQESQTSDDLEKRHQHGGRPSAYAITTTPSKSSASFEAASVADSRRSDGRRTSTLRPSSRSACRHTRVEIERCIFVVVNAHPLVYAFPTTNQPGTDTVFWYDSAEEFGVSCWDNREFVREHFKSTSSTSAQPSWSGAPSSHSRWLRWAGSRHLVKEYLCPKINRTTRRNPQRSDPTATCKPKPKWTSSPSGGVPRNLLRGVEQRFQRAHVAGSYVFLVEGSSSGIGVAAIQLTKAFGHRVIATRRGPFPTILRQQMMGDQDDRQ
ncbi:hypothetical protein As57867_017081, partial [Aphanomyces stellatus]